MAANIMQNWSGLAPNQDFYRSFMAPILGGQQLSKTEQEILEMELMNQAKREEMPYIASGRQAEQKLQGAQANLMGMQSQELGQMMPYIAEGMKAEQELKRAQAMGHVTDAQANQIRIDNPILLAGNDMAAALFAAEQRRKQGVSGNPATNQPATNQSYAPGMSGGQVDLKPIPSAQNQVAFNEMPPVPGQQNPSISPGKPGGQMQAQNNSVIPELSQPPQTNTLGEQLTPVILPGVPGFQNKMPFNDNASAAKWLQQSAGMVPPESGLTGDTFIDNMMLAKGMDPDRQMNMEMAMMTRENNQKAYQSAQDKAAVDDEALNNLRLSADSFMNAYDNAWATGPIGGNASQLDAASQEAQANANALTPLIARPLNVGHLTDAFLNMISSSKLSVFMHPETAKHMYNKLMSANDRALQYHPFLSIAEQNGLPKKDAELMWSLFQQEHPLTGDRGEDMRSLQYIDSYASPLLAANLKSGNYKPPQKLPLSAIPKEVLKNMAPRQRESLLAREKSIQADAAALEDIEKSANKVND